MKKNFLFLFFASMCFGDVLDGLGLNNISLNEKDYTCIALPPTPPPAQQSGGEGVPPLPLPAVPQRRTEKKNPPRPPVLIAKISTEKQSDWATNPSDSDNLLKWMSKNLEVNFSSINIPQNQIPSDPKKIPLLYRTGHESFSFSEEVKNKLSQYLIGGGTIIFDACCGRKDFFESAYKESKSLIPERSPYRLSLDHPVFHCFFDIDSFKYREWAIKSGAMVGDPSCIGIDIGCRTAIFIFRWDLSCGWDELKDSQRHHCLGYDLDTSKKIGSNLMAYITSERSSAIPLSKALNFIDETKYKSGKFTIAQIKYSGNWKTRDYGISMLLNVFHEQTKTPVRFQLEEISLDSPKIFDVPFIYFTGHQNFELSTQERSNLKSFIKRGGILFAEACCGREEFDKSFKIEINKIFEEKLTKIDENNILYNFPNNIKIVSPTPSLAKNLNSSEKIKAELYQININGNPGIIYSKNGLCCGWEMSSCPYCKGLVSTDALSLGVNVLSYSILQ